METDLQTEALFHGSLIFASYLKLKNRTTRLSSILFVIPRQDSMDLTGV